MTFAYRVEFSTPTVSLSTVLGDPAGYGLADPCSIKQSIPNTDLAPLVQGNPDEATVNVIAPDPYTYSFSLGDPVRLVMFSDATAVAQDMEFYGRIAQLQAQPHKLGILYTMTCVDYLADLAELKAGRVDYPLESSQTRVNRMLAENGIGPVVLPAGEVYPGGFNDPNVVARTAATDGQVDLPEALEHVLAGWANGYGTDEEGNALVNSYNGRFQLRPNIVNPSGTPGQGSLDPVSPFRLEKIIRTLGWTPPAKLGPKPGAKLYVAARDHTPATDTLVIDAGHIDYDPLFTQAKGNAVQRVVVAYPGGNYQAADWTTLGGYYGWRSDQSTVEASVTVWQSIPSSVPSTMYKGQIQPDAGLQWTVGELVWHFSRTEPDRAWWPRLRRVVVVTRVDAANATSHNPTGRTFLAGVVDSITATVAGGELVLAFTLAPMHYTTGISPTTGGVRAQATLGEWLPTARRNLFISPQAASGSGWNASNAFSPAATLTENATGGPAVNAPAVPFRRYTSTGTNTPTSLSVICAIQSTTSAVLGSGFPQASLISRPGDQLTLSVYVRCSIAQTVCLEALNLDANGTSTGTPTFSPNVTLVANTWTRLEVTHTVDPASDAVATRLDIRAGTSGRLAWAVGTTFDVAAGMGELSAGPATAYFDGTSAATASLSYTWEHQAGAPGTTNRVPSVEQQLGTLISDLDPRDTYADYMLMHA